MAQKSPPEAALARLRHLVRLLDGVRPYCANNPGLADLELIDFVTSAVEGYLKQLPGHKTMDNALGLVPRKPRSNSNTQRSDQLAVEIDKRLAKHLGPGFWLDDCFLKHLTNDTVKELFEKIEKDKTELPELLPEKRRSRMKQYAGAEAASEVDHDLRKIWNRRAAAVRAYREPIIEKLLQAKDDAPDR